MISNCVECNKEIRYSPFAFDSNSEYAEVTMSGLCSNGIRRLLGIKRVAHT